MPSTRLLVAPLGVVCLVWSARDAVRILDLPVSVAARVRELGGELGQAGLVAALAAPIAIAVISAAGTLIGAIALGRRAAAHRVRSAAPQPPPLPARIAAAPGRF
jgi:hypothetical protein